MINPSEAAWYANEAYKDEPDRDGLVFTTGPHQCTVWSTDTDIIIGFRGTEASKFKIKDFITNLKSKQIKNPLGPGKVHKGYFEGAFDLYSVFWPYIQDYVDKNLVYVGHSMGGALAIQTINFFLPNCIYTFNAPKSGDEEFAKEFFINTPVFRFVSKRDFAQSYPSDTKEWAHVGNKILLESTGHSMDNILKVL